MSTSLTLSKIDAFSLPSQIIAEYAASSPDKTSQSSVKGIASEVHSTLRKTLKDKTHWIYPEEQLKRLAFSVAERVNGIGGLISDLAFIVAVYALDAQLADWYISADLINRLPYKIPKLPDHIHEILNKPCPKEICKKRKPDESFYKVGEKCTLTLVAHEFGTINQFEGIVKSYGEKYFHKKQNPLQLCCNLRIPQDHLIQLHNNRKIPPYYLNSSPEPTHWVLYTNDLLENSQHKPFYPDLVNLVDSLAKKTFVSWQIPNFRDTIVTIFLKKIATGESLLPQSQTDYIERWTRVKESFDNIRLFVGNFRDDGLCVTAYSGDYIYSSKYEFFGMTAMRLF